MFNLTSRQVRARINELPYGHARGAFSALEALRASVWA